MTDQVARLERANEQADLKAHHLFEELMNLLEAEQAERDRAVDEAFLAYEAHGFIDEVEVPA